MLSEKSHEFSPICVFWNTSLVPSPLCSSALFVWVSLLSVQCTTCPYANFSLTSLEVFCLGFSSIATLHSIFTSTRGEFFGLFPHCYGAHCFRLHMTRIARILVPLLLCTMSLYEAYRTGSSPVATVHDVVTSLEVCCKGFSPFNMVHDLLPPFEVRPTLSYFLIT